MSTTTITHEASDPYVTKLVVAANKKVKRPAFIQGGDGGVVIDVVEDATNDEVISVIEALGAYGWELEKQRTVVNYNICRLVAIVAARNNKTLQEAIIDLGIAQRLGLKPSTMLNWMAVPAKLDEGMIKEYSNLSWGCFLRAAEVMVPTEPEKAIDHMAKMRAILAEANADPINCSSSWVRAKMHQLRNEHLPEGLFDPMGSRTERVSDTLNMMRVLRLVDEGMDIKDTKFSSRADLVLAIEEGMNWCLTRKLVQEDPITYTPFCLRKGRKKKQEENYEQEPIPDDQSQEESN